MTADEESFRNNNLIVRKEPIDGLYLSYGWDSPKKNYRIGMITDKDPSKGETMNVYDIMLSESVRDLKKWFVHSAFNKPWKTKH